VAAQARHTERLTVQVAGRTKILAQPGAGPSGRQYVLVLLSEYPLGRLLILGGQPIVGVVPLLTVLVVGGGGGWWLARHLTRPVRQLRAATQARQGAVTLVAAEACRVAGTTELPRSAIENVVRNAVRYSTAGTTTEMRVSVHDIPARPHAVIEVRDYGPRVPEAELAHLFQPFYRLTLARVPQPDGRAMASKAASFFIGTAPARSSIVCVCPTGLEVLPRSRCLACGMGRWRVWGSPPDGLSKTVSSVSAPQ
jgi:hypothetical protein